jgi:hypothetical protein
MAYCRIWLGLAGEARFTIHSGPVDAAADPLVQRARWQLRAFSRDTRHRARLRAVAGRLKGEGISSSMGRAEDHRMDVVAWLRGLGLEQFAPAFRENDVDAEVLPELTPEDLIGLGVTSIGHRRKLLAAIAALRAEAPIAAATAAPRDAPVHTDAERRQLTVMFCDLVGSTALSERLDPEDLREVIGAYHRCVADTVGRFGGFVAKYMGDGVLVYFGYPQAHEDDAERAVRAGLAVLDGAARRHLEKGLAPYDRERDRARAVLYGFDLSMGCHSFLAHVLWDQGFPDEALHHAEEAIAAARTAAHPLSEAWAIAFAANIRQLRGEVGRCLERAAATLALATEQVLPYFVARAQVFSGWALVKEGKGEEGLARLRAGLDAYHAVGSRVCRSESLALFADASLATGRIEEGLSAVRDAFSEVEETDTRFYEPELNRLQGELVLASEEPDESRGEASFRKAIAIARTQQAKSWELRAATSLARLLARQEKHDEARELLAPAYGWFTEGLGTRVLQEAKALLDELN